jgi:hypothetical protein
MKRTNSANARIQKLVAGADLETVITITVGHLQAVYTPDNAQDLQDDWDAIEQIKHQLAEKVVLGQFTDPLSGEPAITDDDFDGFITVKDVRTGKRVTA